MPEILLEKNIEIWCSCGEGLCLQSESVAEEKLVWEGGYATGPCFVVDPCPKCCKKKTTKKKRSC